MQERVNSLDDETASHVSSVLLEMVKVVNEATGMRQLLTKREALLVCTGFKTGEALVMSEYGIDPIIMKKIAWNEPAQPAIRDDYFSSLIGPEMDADKAVELVDRMQKRVDSLDEETVSPVSSVLLEVVKLANELSGMDNTLTKREALLVCMGFKIGEAYVCGKYGINE